ncbi:MAG: hypothetical protein KGQ54_02580, partial [Verrucomicrobia bacterium]|nr:hypothetical protein [Verrucomicrobiota bacterium]
WMTETRKEINPQRMGQIKEGHMDQHHKELGYKHHGAESSRDKVQERRPIHGSPMGMKNKNRDKRF